MRRFERGFTLIEIMITTTFLSVIAVGIYYMYASAGDCYKTVYNETTLTFNLRSTLDQITEEFRQSKSSMITLDTSNPNHDSITFQVPLTNDGDTVTWGAEGNAAWKIKYFVEGEKLKKRILDENNQPVDSDTIIATHVDNLRDTQKGFSVSINGNIISLSLRCYYYSDLGGDIIREASTSLTLRN